MKAIDLALSEPVRRIFHLLPAHAGKIEQSVRGHTGILEREILDIGLDDSTVVNGKVFRHLHNSVSQDWPFIVFFVKICFPLTTILLYLSHKERSWGF